MIKLENIVYQQRTEGRDLVISAEVHLCSETRLHATTVRLSVDAAKTKALEVKGNVLRLWDAIYGDITAELQQILDNTPRSPETLATRAALEQLSQRVASPFKPKNKK